MKKLPIHLGSSIAIFLGIAMIAEYGTQDPINPRIFGYFLLFLGAIAYRSGKKRRLGQAQDTLLRLLVERSFIGLIIWGMLTGEFEFSFIEYPINMGLIPVATIIAYIIEWQKSNNVNSYIYKNNLEKTIKKISQEYNFCDGYKLLYCPWKTIGRLDTAFISLNPGIPPDGCDLEVISEEKGNSYVVEEKITKSPITEQFLLFSRFINKDPSDLLTGVICPFRGDNWDNFTSTQKEKGIEIGVKFWSDALKKSAKKIVATGEDTAKALKGMFDFHLEKDIPSGWGSTRLKRYKAKNGIILIQLPHLSRYKLFSREECKGPLKEIFDLPDNTYVSDTPTENKETDKKKDKYESSNKEREQNMPYHPKDIFKLNPGALDRVQAPHNMTRITWIGEEGKDFSEINAASSVYRQNIRRGSYTLNSRIDTDLKYDLKKKFLRHIPYKKD